MRVIDTRDQTTMQGKLIATIPAGQPVSDADMKRFYGMGPGARNFELLSAAQSTDRVVLQRGGGVDPASNLEGEPSYYIVPKYPFYRIEP